MNQTSSFLRPFIEFAIRVHAASIPLLYMNMHLRRKLYQYFLHKHNLKYMEDQTNITKKTKRAIQRNTTICVLKFHSSLSFPL